MLPFQTNSLCHLKDSFDIKIIQLLIPRLHIYDTFLLKNNNLFCDCSFDACLP